MIGKEDKLTHYLITIAFNGTSYNGWQSQPCGNTVQDHIVKLLRQLFKENIVINGSSRTDSGVHALGMCASFSVPAQPNIPQNNIQNFLNNSLPKTIVITNIKEVKSDFHARFAACAKTYSFVINKNSYANPFTADLSWHIPNFTYICEVCKALTYLEGDHDFSAFTVKRKEVDNTCRTIYKTEVVEFGNFICINITGSGFLYKMVRSIIGSIFKIGIGSHKPEELKRVLESKMRSEGSKTAPGNGLYLMKVYYKEDEWKSFELKNLPFIDLLN